MLNSKYTSKVDTDVDTDAFRSGGKSIYGLNRALSGGISLDVMQNVSLEAYFRGYCSDHKFGGARRGELAGKSISDFQVSEGKSYSLVHFWTKK